MNSCDTLCIIGRYENEGGNDLEGKIGALATLSDVLRSETPDSEYRLVVPEGVDAAPYDGFLARLRLLLDEGPVRVVRQGETLIVKGSIEGLDTIAQNIAFLLQSQVETDHVHIDYYDSHPYLSSETAPLTISADRS